MKDKTKAKLPKTKDVLHQIRKNSQSGRATGKNSD